MAKPDPHNIRRIKVLLEALDVRKMPESEEIMAWFDRIDGDGPDAILTDERGHIMFGGTGEGEGRFTGLQQAREFSSAINHIFARSREGQERPAWLISLWNESQDAEGSDRAALFQELHEAGCSLAREFQYIPTNIVTLLAYRAGIENPTRFMEVIPGNAFNTHERANIEAEKKEIEDLVNKMTSYTQPYYTHTLGVKGDSEIGRDYYNPQNLPQPAESWERVAARAKDSNIFGIGGRLKRPEVEAEFIEKVGEIIEEWGFDTSKIRYLGSGMEQYVICAEHQSGEVCRIAIKTQMIEHNATVSPATSPQTLPIIDSRPVVIDGKECRVDVQPMVASVSPGRLSEDYGRLTEIIHLGLLAYNRFCELEFGKNPHLVYTDSGQEVGLGPCRSGKKHITPVLFDQNSVRCDEVLYNDVLERLQNEEAPHYPHYLKAILESEDPEFLLNPFPGIDWYRYEPGKFREGHATIVGSLHVPQVILDQITPDSTVSASSAEGIDLAAHMGRYSIEEPERRLAANCTEITERSF